MKVDVDTRPPAGAVTETRLVRRHVSVRIHHHDRASLLAGKLQAVLQRPWTKGRDIFDLAWYLSDPGWPQPNLVLLNAALHQGDPAAVPVTGETWRASVAERIASLNWNAIHGDVRPFLEPGVEMVGRGELLGLLGG